MDKRRVAHCVSGLRSLQEVTEWVLRGKVTKTNVSKLWPRTCYCATVTASASWRNEEMENVCRWRIGLGTGSYSDSDYLEERTLELGDSYFTLSISFLDEFSALQLAEWDCLVEKSFSFEYTDINWNTQASYVCNVRHNDHWAVNFSVIFNYRFFTFSLFLFLPFLLQLQSVLSSGTRKLDRRIISNTYTLTLIYL